MVLLLLSLYGYGCFLEGLFGYGCGSFEAWFGWLHTGSFEFWVVLAMVMVAMWIWCHRCAVHVVWESGPSLATCRQCS
jgi:hypothetical protein